MNHLYLCMGVSRQGHWEAVKRATEQAQKEPYYIGLMAEVREMHPGMGLRTMYDQFMPEGIGRDAFIALGLREGFRLKAISNPIRTTLSVKSNKYGNLCIGKQFTDVNQLWVSDIFYFPLNERHYYAVLIMDVYSRRLLGYSVADNLRAENNLKALDMALSIRGIEHYHFGLIHHSDKGSQYISSDYTGVLEDRGIQISMCNDVLENAHSERVNGTIKNDYLNRWMIKNVQDLQTCMGKAYTYYNNRNHHSLKMTPLQFEAYIQTIAPQKRPIMEIYTIKKSTENPLQLKFEYN